MKMIFLFTGFLTILFSAQASHAMGAKLYSGYAGQITDAKGRVVGTFHKVTSRQDVSVADYQDHFGMIKMSMQLDAMKYENDLIDACKVAGLNYRLAELNVLVLRGVRGQDYFKKQEVYDIMEDHSNCDKVLNH